MPILPTLCNYEKTRKKRLNDNSQTSGHHSAITTTASKKQALRNH